VTVQPDLTFLQGSALRALPFIRAMVAQGASANSIISQLKLGDTPLRRQTALDIISLLKGKGDLQNIIRLTSPNTPLPQEAHEPSVVNISSNYQYLVLAENTNAGIDAYVTVSSAVPLSANNIFAVAGTLFTGPGDYGITQSQYLGGTLSIEKATVGPEAPLP